MTSASPSRPVDRGEILLEAEPLTVPQRPARAGIDPYNLLDWEEGDNIEALDIQERSAEETP
jgi:hypothetical protein